jgi:hypothetical protein
VLALAVAALLPGAGRAREILTSDSRLLQIELLVFRGLGERQIGMLKHEVDAIWAAQDVAIEWTTGITPGRVRVLVDRPATALPASARDEPWSVASARLVAGQVTYPIYVSLDAAERVVRGSSPPYSSPGLAGTMLPRVAGRALAHELAHFLLNTRAHTSGGLLRARFTSDDFLAPALDGFTLTGEQMAKARQHQTLLALGR